MSSRLAKDVAKKLINEWALWCKEDYKKRKGKTLSGDTPCINFSRKDQYYFLKLQELIADEIERVQEAANS